MYRVFFILCLCLLTACSDVKDTLYGWVQNDDDNADPPAPLVEFRQGINVIQIWSRKTGIGTDEQYLTLAPIVANQRLFIADINGDIKSLDATNGQVRWSKKLFGNIASKFSFWKETDSEHITGGPGYGENTILVGTSEGNIFAFSSESGEEIWRTKVSSEILSTPQKQNNVVIARTLDGKVVALEGDNGRRLWIDDSRSVPTLTLRGTSTPVIFQGLVIAGFDGGRLAAMDLQTGRLLWEIRITTPAGSTELEQIVDLDSTPVVINGFIYVASYQGSIASVRLETGQIQWSRDISSYAGFSVDDDNIYVTDEESNIWALDRFSGNSVWKLEKLHARGVTAPELIGDYLVVGDVEGYLHWIDKRNGDFVARTRLSDERIISKPIAVGKFLYAYCSNGELAAYTYR